MCVCVCVWGKGESDPSTMKKGKPDYVICTTPFILKVINRRVCVSMPFNVQKRHTHTLTTHTLLTGS